MITDRLNKFCRQRKSCIQFSMANTTDKHTHMLIVQLSKLLSVSSTSLGTEARCHEPTSIRIPRLDSSLKMYFSSTNNDKFAGAGLSSWSF